MIKFDKDNIRFMFRIAGIAINNGNILLQSVAGQEFWFIPGGRCELLEKAEDTLRREMKEEVRADIEIERPLWFCENFFSVGSRTFHELGFYFKINFLPGSEILNKDEITVFDDGYDITLRWYPLGRIEKMNLLPSFLKKGVLNLPNNLQHIVSTDNFQSFPVKIHNFND